MICHNLTHMIVICECSPCLLLNSRIFNDFNVIPLKNLTVSCIHSVPCIQLLHWNLFILLKYVTHGASIIISLLCFFSCFLECKDLCMLYFRYHQSSLMSDYLKDHRLFEDRVISFIKTFYQSFLSRNHLQIEILYKRDF